MRCSSPARSASRPWPTIRAPVAGAALRAPARGQGRSRSVDADAHRPPRGLRAGRGSSPPSSSGATATSSSTRSARAGPDGAGVRLPRARLVARDRGPPTDSSWPRSAATPRARAVLAWCARAGPGPRWTAARADSGLRNLVVREGRRSRPTSRYAWSPVRTTSTPTASPRGGRLRGPDVDPDRRPRRPPRGVTTRSWPGAPALEEEVGDLRLRDLSLRVLPDEHRDGRAPVRGRRRAGPTCRAGSVLDLYYSVGTVGLSLAARAGEIWGIEIVEEAVADAIANARPQRDRQRALLRGDHLRLALGELVERGQPPRRLRGRPAARGLSQKIVRRVVEAAPRRIVYISCNPTTLAPNAAQLVEAATCCSAVARRHVPQTPHIECVAVLERGPAAAAPAATAAEWRLRVATARRPYPTAAPSSAMRWGPPPVACKKETGTEMYNILIRDVWQRQSQFSRSG